MKWTGRIRGMGRSRKQREGRGQRQGTIFGMRPGVLGVVGVKVAALVPLGLVLVGADDAQRGVPAPGVAFAVEKPGGGSAITTSTAGTPQADRVHGDGASADFAAESRGVRELVEAIRRRNDELGRRDSELARREATLESAALDLDRKIKHLEALTGGPETEGSSGAPGAGGGAQGESMGESMAALGKIYGAMKAEESAPLFDRLDNATVFQIFQYMKQRQISAVLPLMNREKAVALTELMGGRHRPVRDQQTADARR